MNTNNKTQDGWPEGWLIAAAAAVMAAVLGRVIGDMGVWSTLLLGTFVFLVFGVLLGLLWGSAPTGGHSYAHVHKDDHGHAPPASSPVARAPAATAFAETPVTAAPPVTENVALPVAAPVMGMPAMDVPVRDAPLGDAPVEVKSMAAPQPISLMADAVVAEPAPPALPVAAPEPVVMTGEAAKPDGLPSPRGGVADSLQTIEGIGPVMEKLCHDLGIYHFDQIAGWKASEIAWMDGNLKGFKGRVTRDKWVRQAALIGEVGIEEFLRRAKTNDF